MGVEKGVEAETESQRRGRGEEREERGWPGTCRERRGRRRGREGERVREGRELREKGQRDGGGVKQPLV